jgi:hypothetical protein
MNPTGLLINLLIATYHTQGRDGLVRMLTLSEDQIKHIEARTHGDLQGALAERGEWAEKTADFVELLALPAGA